MKKYSAKASSDFFFLFPFVIIGFICLFIYLFNFEALPKSLGPGLLSLCIKTALYRRLGRDESPAVDSVCVRAHIDGSGESPTVGRACVRAHLRYRCESYCRLRLCAHLTYGAVGVVRSIAFVCVRVRVTGSGAIQPVCLLMCFARAVYTFYRNNLCYLPKWMRVGTLAERRRGLFIYIKIRALPGPKLSCAPLLASVPKLRCTW